MKKKLFTLLLVMVALVGLAACKDKEKGEIIDFSKVLTQKEEITVWLDDQNGEYAAELIEAFNRTEEGKGISVVHRHAGIVETRERLKVVGPIGGGPDVFQFPHDHLVPALLEDLLYAFPTDVREFVKERSHPVGLKAGLVHYNETTGEYGEGVPGAEEKLYAVPTSVESIGLYYNKALVQNVPATFEELLTEGAAWNAKQEEGGSGITNLEKGYPYLTTSSHWADSYFMQPFYSAFDHFPFGKNLDNKNEVGFDKPELEAALTWIRDSLKPVVSGDTDDPKGSGSSFESGNIPYILAGPWNREAYKEANIDLGIAQIPTINGKPVKTFAGAVMTAIYKYSKHTDAATKFVKFMASDEAMNILYKHKGKLPAIKADLYANIEGLTADDILMGMAKQLETSVPMPSIPEIQYYWGPGEAMLRAVYKSGTDIKTAMQEAQDSYNTLLNL